MGDKSALIEVNGDFEILQTTKNLKINDIYTDICVLLHTTTYIFLSNCSGIL